MNEVDLTKFVQDLLSRHPFNSKVKEAVEYACDAQGLECREGKIVKKLTQKESNSRESYLKEAYEKALYNAETELRACGSLDCDAARLVFRIFPELNSAMEEEIRKSIIAFIKKVNEAPTYCIPEGKYSVRQMVNWLERQCKQDIKGFNMDKPANDGEALEPSPSQICLKIYEYLCRYCEENQAHIIDLEKLAEGIYKTIRDCFGVRTNIKN